MKKILAFSFIIMFGQTYCQECFQFDIPITDIQKWEYKLEYVVLEENDSLVKICWWPRNSFRANVYNGRKVVNAYIIKAMPLKENLKDYEFHEHPIKSDLIINEKYIEFYTLCY